MLMAERLGVGTGTFQARARKSILRRWQVAANMGGRPRGKRLTAGALVGSGFAVQVVGRKKSDPPKPKPSTS